MKNKILLLLFSAFLASCSEQRMAKIEYKDAESPHNYYEKVVSSIDSESGLVSRKLNRSSDTIKDIEEEIIPDNSLDMLGKSDSNLDESPFIIVRPGDNLLNISKEYDIDFDALVRENKLKKPYNLELGQILKIPTYNNVVRKGGSSFDSLKKERAAPVVLTSTLAQFIMPIDNGEVIFSFGEETDLGIKNEGINFKAAAGSNVYSVASGRVVYASNQLEDYGNLVIIKHDNSLATIYAHLDKILVKKGEDISLGHIIGKVGSTGNVSFPQLHFSVRKNKKTVDPALYIPKKNL